jgi:S-adenosylmethionine:tRNA ribosyltransferase-isomerase
VKVGEFLTLNGNGSCPPPRVGEGSGERSGFKILSKQNGRAVVQIESDTDIFEKYGTVPIPPYFERPAEKEDEEDYQTVFARTPGASAAPTAGLHFTPELLDKIKSKGVEIAYLSLLVGPGTFEPIRGDDLSQHKMHAEYFEIGEETCAKINAAKKSDKKIWVVGTTVVKALETACRGLIKQTPTVGANGVRPSPPRVGEGLREWSFSGNSDLFIYPPFDFKIVDGLITNFHWPRSTLILLVAAFAGKDQILSAYNEAISRRYRFFSYGDAMLIY